MDNIWGAAYFVMTTLRTSHSLCKTVVKLASQKPAPQCCMHCFSCEMVITYGDVDSLFGFDITDSEFTCHVTFRNTYVLCIFTLPICEVLTFSHMSICLVVYVCYMHITLSGVTLLVFGAYV